MMAAAVSNSGPIYKFALAAASAYPTHDAHVPMGGNWSLRLSHVTHARSLECFPEFFRSNPYISMNRQGVILCEYLQDVLEKPLRVTQIQTTCAVIMRTTCIGDRTESLAWFFCDGLERATHRCANTFPAGGASSGCFNSTTPPCGYLLVTRAWRRRVSAHVGVAILPYTFQGCCSVHSLTTSLVRGSHFSVPTIPTPPTRFQGLGCVRSDEAQLGTCLPRTGG